VQEGDRVVPAAAGPLLNNGPPFCRRNKQLLRSRMRTSAPVGGGSSWTFTAIASLGQRQAATARGGILENRELRLESKCREACGKPAIELVKVEPMLVNTC